ncbi:MAG TPA: ATP-binding cassette domain-containing protein, partial [Kofleriaceae bacterium]
MISAKGLARTFRTKQGVVEAVRGIDLEVAAGEIVGLLGPNGAGKTTSFYMIVGLVKPNGGRVFFQGIDVT